MWRSGISSPGPRPGAWRCSAGWWGPGATYATARAAPGRPLSRGKLRPGGGGTTAQPFEVTLQGIRSSDGAVLYAGVDTVVVSGGGANPPVSVPVSYIGPCRIGSGCIVTVAPQDSTLATGGSFVLRISVDSAQTPVTGVPVALTNLTPGLVLVAPDRTVTALLSPPGGAARVEAAIAGAAGTLGVT